MRLEVLDGGLLLRNATKDFTAYRERSADFGFTPRLEDFTGSTEPAHNLVGRVVATDDFGGLDGYSEVPFVVNRLTGIVIGAVAFTRPRAALNASKQTYRSVVGVGPAVIKIDVFDPDVFFPPVPEYVHFIFLTRFFRFPSPILCSHRDISPVLGDGVHYILLIGASFGPL